jgi:eukaryotic-like serine/threonine-protein kinase
MLRAFVRGRLAEDDLNTVVGHVYVQSCQRCGELLLAMPQTTASVLAPPPVPAGPDGVRTILARPTGLAAPAGEAREFRGLRLGRYVVRELLGKGGFGAVYAAFDDGLRREVAVKVPFESRLAGEDLGEVRTEAWRHASLDHPNIVPIYDIGESAEVPVFFVSKLVRGESLAARVERSPLSPREAAELLVPLALALDHMRQRGLVHRDVKPRNVLLDEAGTPYLTDFGLATRPSAGGAPERLLLAGTLPYMSPEQAAGQADRVDHRTDVYALGVVLYELLTGERPFQGDVPTMREQIQHRPPVPPRRLDGAVPRDLEAICLKALAKAPADRYQEAGQLAEDLACWLRGEPPRHVESARLRGGLWWLRRRREPVGWVVLALLALTLVVWVATRPAPAPEPPHDPSVVASVRTEPAGASVSYFPLDEMTGEPRPAEVVRGKDGEAVRLPPGHYLVVAVSDAEPARFHEVFRLVPGRGDAMAGLYRHEKWSVEGDVVQLPTIKLPPADAAKEMCFLPEGKGFETVDPAPRQRGGKLVDWPVKRRVPAFYLDPTEVTNEAYLPWLKQQKAPAQVVIHQPDHPASGVTWHEAVAFAEYFGKRLPDEYEYEYAATACGKSRFPWGDSADRLKAKRWAFGPVRGPGIDRLLLPGGQTAVYGLYSNVLEWTSSRPGEAPGGGLAFPVAELRVVRGGPASLVSGAPDFTEEAKGPRDRLCLPGLVHKMEPMPGLGFRCARSARPRLEAKDFGGLVGP